MRILITGGSGMIGERLKRRCLNLGHSVIDVDIRPEKNASVADIRVPRDWATRAGDIDGIIHLAAISRVAWGERDPALCKSINVDGTAAIVQYAEQAATRPWVLFASSREVYGNPRRHLVSEDDGVAPVNAYGQSKLAGEVIVDRARQRGLATATVRLSNVYGGPRDHPDRAVPALVACAITGRSITLTGAAHYFDFVHVDDVVDGLLRSMKALTAGERRMPPVHLATGRATSLGELARLVTGAASSKSTIINGDARLFDVEGFCGDPTRAFSVLGWRAIISLEVGLNRLISDIRRDGPPATVEMPM